MPRECLRFASSIKLSLRTVLHKHRHDLCAGELLGEQSYQVHSRAGAHLADTMIAAGRDPQLIGPELAEFGKQYLADHPHTMPTFAAETRAIRARLKTARDDDKLVLEDLLLRVKEAKDKIRNREFQAGIRCSRAELAEFFAAIAERFKVDWHYEVPLVPTSATMVRKAGCRGY